MSLCKPSESSSPAISVLVPVFNCAPYLDEALWSIRRQTFEDFECVFVNDGSTDRSGDVLAHHASQDRRILVVNQPNGGIVSALNAGLSHCRGEFIARMDGDDIALPNRFARQIEFLRANPGIGAVGGWARVIDAEGNKLGDQTIIRMPITHSEINGSLASGGYALIHPTVMIRAEALRRVRGYDPEFRVAEDLDLFLRLGEITQLANMPEVVLHYRRRPNSQSLVYSSAIARWDVKALRRAKARGRPITRETFARAEDRISWRAVSEGDRSAAFAHALQAFALQPWSPIGYKAIARVIHRTFRRSA